METNRPEAASSVAATRWLLSGNQLAIVVLLAVVTLVAAYQTREWIAKLQQARFANEVQRTDSAIEERMAAYTQVLRSGLGLFLSSDDVTRAEWSRFVGALKLGERYPGFKVFTYAPAVRQQDLPGFLAGVRAEPTPPELVDPMALRNYRLNFGGSDAKPLPLHVPILYAAPFEPNNQLALGVDLMQEPIRRAMLEEAARTGEAVLSPRLRLMQSMPSPDGLKSEASFINVVAIKQDERLLGWLTVACKAEDFMGALLGGEKPALNIEIFDGLETDADALLYSTAGVDAQRGPVLLGAAGQSPLMHDSQVQVSSRVWTIRYSAPPGFFQLSEQIAPWLVAFIGVLASLLFYSVARSGARWRSQAEALHLAESAVRHQATHDSLTGLANRVLFMDRLQLALERARRRKQRIALIYIDIDGFKPVNDSHGHHIGDALLIGIAQRLKARQRREDTTARLGGDEFALILEDAINPHEQAQHVGEEIIGLLSKPFELSDGGRTIVVSIGASVGIAHFPDHGVDADRLVVAADAAMYRAKRSGRNRCVQADGIQAEVFLQPGHRS